MDVIRGKLIKHEERLVTNAQLCTVCPSSVYESTFLSRHQDGGCFWCKL